MGFIDNEEDEGTCPNWLWWYISARKKAMSLLDVNTYKCISLKRFPVILFFSQLVFIPTWRVVQMQY